MRRWARSATLFAMRGLSPGLRRARTSFDAAWYAARYPDVAASGEEPFAHFVRFGRGEGRFPNPIEETRRIWEPSFDAAWYAGRHPDVVEAGIDPFDHFLRFGLPEGRSPNETEEARRNWAARFDQTWYAARYPDVAATADDLFDHFLRSGLSEGRFPNEREEVRTTWEERFDPAWYADRYPDVAAARSDPFDHFLGSGFREDRSPNAQEEALRSRKQSFDARWYVERYPDVAGPTEEPLAHFVRVGLAEGRYANAAEEEHAAWAQRFDREWYVARNPDIAAWELGPFDHFLQFGLAEGRSPNAADERRDAWATRFDRGWYVIRHEDALGPGHDPLEHFLTEGLVRGLAPNPGEERRENWIGIFDAEWYLDQNEDVAGSNVDPLLHYIFTGLQERRRPNGRVQLAGPPATAARARWIKPPSMGQELVLFVTHSADGVLKPHVPTYLEAIRAVGLGCILIVASDADEPRLEPFEMDLVDGILFRENTGFDFAAWAHTIALSPPRRDTDLLILANDSVFGPTSLDRFRGLLDRIRASPGQVVGLTENHERGWHIQSYFVALKGESTHGRPLLDFFANVRSLKHKEQVVTEYESKFSRHLLRAGYDCDVIYPSQAASNITLRNWRKLLNCGFPFLKVSAVNNTIRDADIAGWRELLDSEGYPVTKADGTLSAMAATRPETASNSLAGEPGEVMRLHRFFESGTYFQLPVVTSNSLAIVLIAHNCAERVFSLMEQIKSSELDGAQIICVNNGSCDDTAYLLSRMKNINLIETVEPLPSYQALRLGARQASNAIILALNDTVAELPSNIAEAMNLLTRREETCAVAWRKTASIGKNSDAPLDEPAAFPVLVRRRCLMTVLDQMLIDRARTTSGWNTALLVERGYRVELMEG